MATSDGGVAVIDFDWAGEAGKVHYPLNINLNEGIRWPSGVTCGGLIEKGHDLAMFRLLTGLELEVSD